jgi:hypothetical protein
VRIAPARGKAISSLHNGCGQFTPDFIHPVSIAWSPQRRNIDATIPPPIDSRMNGNFQV